MKYDYIITGAGCAGLSLLYRMLYDPILQTKNILVIDKSQKTENDRTWCFWEKGSGVFEAIITHQWKKLIFKTENFNNVFNLDQYSYKMIQGLDFYHFVLNVAKNFNNVTFKYETINQITEEGDLAIVTTENNRYSAQYVFNSTALFYPEINTANSLLQHFEGWVIRTKNPTFDNQVGTLMDFSLSQQHGTTFMYVLPTSNTEALVEYTLFTEKSLEKDQYKAALENYIKSDLKIKDYEIIHKEFGVIPMSLASFERNPNAQKRIVNIGTAGGFTKASSGYTFQFIQRNTANIVKSLSSGSNPNQALTFRDKMFQWYDRTLVEVILSKSMAGKDIFAKMFNKLQIERILRFLGNESSLLDDLKIITSLPLKPFLIAGIKRLKKG